MFVSQRNVTRGWFSIVCATTRRAVVRVQSAAALASRHGEQNS